MKNSTLIYNRKYAVGMLMVILLLVSCGTKRVSQKRTPTTMKQSTRIESKTSNFPDEIEKTETEVIPEKAEKETVYSNPVEAYIAMYAAIAQEEMKLYGVPASITIAQGILESGAGSGDLTLRSNNHFGIKCNGWQGAKVYHDDDELQECFRKYNDAKYSFRDHSLFLYERPRYAFLFDYEVTDYASWAKGLRKAGYATDKKYPEKLISLIERYKLYQLDEAVVLGNPVTLKPSSRQQATATPAVYQVQPGDTLYKIAHAYRLTIEELKKINRLQSDTIYVGQKLQLKP